MAVMLVALVFAIAAPAQAAPGGSMRVYVQYAPGRAAGIERALQNAGAQFHYHFADLEAFVVTLPAAAVEGMSRSAGVVLIEEDVPRYLMGPANPAVYAEALAPLMAQSVPYGVTMVQAPDVWAAGSRGTGVKVCIIDSGYYEGHEDLPVAAGGTSQVGTDWRTDGYGHGTHVAGTIVGEDNGVGVIGVSPAASVHIVKIFDDNGNWTLSSNLVDAINSCASAGTDIISMSLGGGSPSVTERRAFDKLYGQGILHIAAAGNAGNNTTSYPAGYGSVMSVAAVDSSMVVADFSQKNADVEIAAPGVGVLSTVPFIDTNTLTVDGVAYSALHIEFSGRGTATGALVNGGLCDSVGSWSGKVVLCERGVISFYDKVINVQNGGGVAAVIYNNAPGNFSGTLGDGNSSAIPAISISQENGQYLVANKLGLSATVTSTLTKPASGYEAWEGTSMATPHVSAVAALLWSAFPAVTNQQIRDAMNNTALDLGAAGRDNAYGYGLVQAMDAYNSLDGGSGGTITLAVAGRTVRNKFYADLTWSGAAGANVDVYRNGALSTTTANDGAYTDNVGRTAGTYTYKVCEAGTTNCSNEASVTFP
jgi:subtilisin family serine protease